MLQYLYVSIEDFSCGSIQNAKSLGKLLVVKYFSPYHALRVATHIYVLMTVHKHVADHEGGHFT